jgi:hypothetical protein
MREGRGTLNVAGEVVAFARETVVGWESLLRSTRGRTESLPRSVVVLRIRYTGGNVTLVLDAYL